MIVYIIKSLGSLLFCVTNQEKKLAQLLVEICCFFLNEVLCLPIKPKKKKKERERKSYSGFKKENVALHLKKKMEEKEKKKKLFLRVKIKNIRALKSVRVFFFF